MNKIIHIAVLVFLLFNGKNCYAITNDITAEKLLGNANYPAICYGGYRTNSREVQPTIAELKEDMKILSALNFKLLRTYNLQYKEVLNLLIAISELKKENPNFEMYLMLGAWIDCKDAWTNLTPNHNEESSKNTLEIAEAVKLTNQYPGIIKIIAVGNEAMVKWATSYYVQPKVILKWVKYLQNLKKEQKLPTMLWITSSDNFASWGGGSTEYHTDDLKQLFKAVDYVSIHTYPMHDTHYNPNFWGILDNEKGLSEKEKIDASVLRARDYAVAQYTSVLKYMKSIGVNKPIHIGETGWATRDDGFYGNEGSKAADEYKSAQYYNLMREWTNKEGITCFYFEAFDENWKNASNPLGSENHFGLFNIHSQAKYVLWDMVNKGVFNGLNRNGKSISKTYEGNEKALWQDVKTPSLLKTKN
jgi:exo-beta-1,3-glucanase (GH17 family)